jgi:hypothetical protein
MYLGILGRAGNMLHGWGGERRVIPTNWWCNTMSRVHWCSGLGISVGAAAGLRLAVRGAGDGDLCLGLALNR